MNEVQLKFANWPCVGIRPERLLKERLISWMMLLWPQPSGPNPAPIPPSKALSDRSNTRTVSNDPRSEATMLNNGSSVEPPPSPKPLSRSLDTTAFSFTPNDDDEEEFPGALAHVTPYQEVQGFPFDPAHVDNCLSGSCSFALNRSKACRSPELNGDWALHGTEQRFGPAIMQEITINAESRNFIK